MSLRIAAQAFEATDFLNIFLQTINSDKFDSQLNRKSKTWFFI